MQETFIIKNVKVGTICPQVTRIDHKFYIGTKKLSQVDMCI